MDFKQVLGNKKVSVPQKQNNLKPDSLSPDRSVALTFLKNITRWFSPYWLACIPLTAIIVVVWNSAAVAQGFDAPADMEQMRVVLDSVFLLFCSVLVIFMNAGFGMLETGFCRQKNADL